MQQICYCILRASYLATESLQLAFSIRLLSCNGKHLKFLHFTFNLLCSVFYCKLLQPLKGSLCFIGSLLVGTQPTRKWSVSLCQENIPRTRDGNFAGVAQRNKHAHVFTEGASKVNFCKNSYNIELYFFIS